MAYSCVRVYFEIGHEAALRNKRTIEGFTHDWEVFVRGVDNAEIHHFVDKVVFHLHDTFPKPKRTIKEPPYVVKESGYAGFNLAIDIYFKNKDEHRKQRFYYDLTLQPSGPRLTKLIKEKADFTNPPEDFRRKLIRGGGVGVGNDSGGSVEKSTNITLNSHNDDSKSSPHSGKPKLNNSSSDIPKKHKPKESSKPEESRGPSFASLFGTPIKTVKHSPTSKPVTKSSSSSEIKNSHDKQVKETSKISKHSPHKEKDKDKENSYSKHKDKDRDKEKEIEKLSKDKNKEKEHKEKEKSKEKVLKKSISPTSSKDVRRDESAKKPSEENSKDRFNSKNEIREKKHKEKKHKEDREKKESHKDHDKKEIEKEKIIEKIEKKQEIIKDKDIKENKFKSNEKEDKKSKPPDREKERIHDSERQKQKHKRKEKHRKEDEKDRHKKKPKEKTPEPILPPKPKSPTPPPPPPAPVKSSINPLNMLIQELSDKDSDSDFSVSMEEDVKSDPPSEPPLKIPKIEEKKIDVREEREKVKKKEKKNKDEEKESKKRKRKIKDKDEPIEKIVKTETKEELLEKSPKREERSESPETQFTEDYVTQLRDLQQKIMTLQDNADLQRVVQVISETGQFEITQRTFDFDLCALDRSTVKRLQDMFITAS